MFDKNVKGDGNEVARKVVVMEHEVEKEPELGKGPKVEKEREVETVPVEMVPVKKPSKGVKFQPEVVEQPEVTKLVAPPQEAPPAPPVFSEDPFRRSLSKHRQDAARTHSKQIDTTEIIAALTASLEKVDDEKHVQFEVKKVQFVEASKPKHVLFKEPSRESDEVAVINNELPWQKKHQFRTVTPFLKPATRAKATSHENIAFRPIETSLSTEDISKEIVKPVPIFASKSKSYQELPTSWEFKSFDQFQTKSSDDLLMDNIDGLRKPESKRHRLLRIRSTSNNSVNRLSDQLVYQNFHYDIPEVPLSADTVVRRKAPQPLPRIVDVTKRNSKTLVYVLNKERDEFELENSSDEDEVYEDVLLRNNIDRHSDATMFSSLVDSRDDRKWQLWKALCFAWSPMCCFGKLPTVDVGKIKCEGMSSVMCLFHGMSFVCVMGCYLSVNCRLNVNVDCFHLSASNNSSLSPLSLLTPSLCH